MTPHGSAPTTTTTTTTATATTGPATTGPATAGVRTSRRHLFRWAAALGGTAAVTGCAGSVSRAAAPARPERITDPAQALDLLREGNRRFSAAPERRTTLSAQRREHLADGQHPFAAVLSCADSRVPPELVFDQGLGDLFVVRTAGHVVAPPVLGSLQYAVEHLHVPLVLVLGHTGCGAVSATLDAVRGASAPTGTAVDSLVDAIRPAAERALDGPDTDRHLPDAVRFNVSAGVDALAQDPVLARAAGDGHLRVAGATYDLREGTVTLL
ncbi:carbonic anhydrase [Kineococcus terrestris]|uniref:carbonic anhydrase n=1 Tax=Kineococcus terrestris TaxID=2044856 RepID=UPI0034DB089F